MRSLTSTNGPTTNSKQCIENPGEGWRLSQHELRRNRAVLARIACSVGVAIAEHLVLGHARYNLSSVVDLTHTRMLALETDRHRRHKL